MKRGVALVVASLIAGCCNCSDAHLPEHPQRPGDVVRELRDAVGDRQWAKAEECFSAEIRARDGEAMRAGDFAWPLGPRDVVVAVDIEGDGAAVAKVDAARAHEVLLAKDREGRWHITSWH